MMAPRSVSVLSSRQILNSVVPPVAARCMELAGSLGSGAGDSSEPVQSWKNEHVCLGTTLKEWNPRDCGWEWLWRVGLHNLSRSSSPSTVYEAGKAAKAGFPPSVSGVPGPYSIPSVPLGGAPSSGMLMDKPHPPPLATSDSTGGSHSGKCGPTLPHSTLDRGPPSFLTDKDS